MSAGEFLSRLKQGAFADPVLAELRGGRAARARPVAGQAASVLRRLEQQLRLVAAHGGAAVYVRPLVRLGPAELWRPPLALAPARGAATPALVWGTFEAARASLIVELGDDAAAQERAAGYAAAGAPELWLLALCRGWTVRYRSPWAGSFASRTLWYPGEAVPVAALGASHVEALERGYAPAHPLAGGPDCGGLT